jgi:hypothetical protein
MCPMCLTTTLLVAGGSSAAGGGLISFALIRIRLLQELFRAGRCGLKRSSLP